MTSSVAARTAFSRVKERLVSLTVELEDRCHTVQLLESTLARERGEAAHKAEEASTGWRDRLTSEQSKHRDLLEAELQRADVLLAEKRDVATRTREALALLQRAATDTELATKRVRDAGTVEFEASRKTWREGEGDRRRRFLERKAKEARALTLKGLEPEMARLVERQRVALQELEAESAAELTALRTEVKAELHQATTELRAARTAQTRQLCDKEGSLFRRRIDDLSAQQEERVREIRETLDRDAETLRRTLREDLRRLRDELDQDVRAATAEQVQREKQLRHRFGQDFADAERLYQEQLGQRRSEVLLEREGWADGVQGRLQAASAGGSGDSRAEDPETVAAFAAAETQLRRERDGQIEQMIRELQTQKMERVAALKEQGQRKQQEMLAAHAAASAELRNGRREWITSHVSEVESQQKRREAQRQARERLRAVENDVTALHDTRAAVMGAMADGDVARCDAAAGPMTLAPLPPDLDEARLEVRVKETQTREDEARITCERLDSELAAVHGEEEKAVAERQVAQDRTLQHLHDSVQQAVTERDDEIVALQEALHAEETRGQKLAALIQSYQRQPAAEESSPEVHRREDGSPQPVLGASAAPASPDEPTRADSRLTLGRTRVRAARSSPASPKPRAGRSNKGTVAGRAGCRQSQRNSSARAITATGNKAKSPSNGHKAQNKKQARRAIANLQS